MRLQDARLEPSSISQRIGKSDEGILVRICGNFHLYCFRSLIAFSVRFVISLSEFPAENNVKKMMDVLKIHVALLS